MTENPMLNPLMHCPTISGFGLPILANPGPVSWHPTMPGRLAFYGKKYPRRDLWIADISELDLHRLEVGDIEIHQEMWSLTERTFVDQPRWSPNGEKIVISGVTSHFEIPNLYIIDANTGFIHFQTKSFTAALRSARWSPDGRWLAYCRWQFAKHELWLLDLQDEKSYQILFDRFNNSDPHWHPSGRFLAFTSQRSDADQLITVVALLDLSTGNTSVLSPSDPVHSRYPRWSSDGKMLYFLSDLDGYDAVYKIPMAGGKPVRMSRPSEHDVIHYDLSPDDQWLVYNLSVRSDHLLYAQSLVSGEQTLLSSDPGTNWWPSIDPSSTRVAVTSQGPNTPPHIKIFQLPHGSVIRSFPWVPDLDQHTRVRQVWLRAFDNVQVDSVAFLPNDKPPLAGIVYIHGGPNSQFTHGWYPFLHTLAAQGIAVIAPNFRGSNGYGRTFWDANRFDWGGSVIADWLAAAEWLKDEAGVSDRSIGVYGRSYGGYATMLLMGKHPEIFRAGVCHAGLYDFVEFFEVTFVPNLMVRSMGLPYYHQKRNLEQSPTTYFENIRGPILLTQGELDLGTPAIDAERNIQRLEKLGRKIEYAYYPGEAHDIVHPEHILDVTRKISDFFKMHLMGSEGHIS